MGMHQPQRPWKSMQASNCVLDANLPSIYHIWPHLLCAYPHIYISTVHIYVYIHIWFINTYYIYSFIHFTISPKKIYHIIYILLHIHVLILPYLQQKLPSILHCNYLFLTRTKTSPTFTICSSLRYAAFMAFMSPISWWGLHPKNLELYRSTDMIICIYLYVYIIIVY